MSSKGTSSKKMFLSKKSSNSLLKLNLRFSVFSKVHLVVLILQETFVSSQCCQPQVVSLSSEFIVVICHIVWFQGLISTIAKRPWRNVLNLIVSIILCVCVTYCRAYIFYRLLIENNFLFSDPRGMSGVVYSRLHYSHKFLIHHFYIPLSIIHPGG